MGVLAGYVGGHVSDHVGRRPVLLASWGLSGTVGLLYLVAGRRVLVGLTVFVLAAAFNRLGQAADDALVMDLVPTEERERGFAAVRVASNLGVTVGPVIGAALLLEGWAALFVGQALMALGAWLVAYRAVPRRGAYAPDGPPTRGSLRVVLTDRLFLVFGLGMVLSWVVYNSYETLLPISLTQGHGLRPSVWGLLLVINPAAVAFFQLRLTRWTHDVSAAAKLSTSILLMGVPFLFLAVSAAVPVVAILLVVFVVGEMLWVPAAQAVVARLAPDDLRGAYVGAYGGTGTLGLALAPFVGLQVRGAAGDLAMWSVGAAVSVVGAVLLAVIGGLTEHRGRVSPGLTEVGAGPRL